jgi:hypothetical protein
MLVGVIAADVPVAIALGVTVENGNGVPVPGGGPH